jgi:MFS family permease
MTDIITAFCSLITGTGLATIGFGLLSLFSDTTSFAQLYGFLIIAGAGAGMIYGCSSVAAQSACEPKELGKTQSAP